MVEQEEDTNRVEDRQDHYWQSTAQWGQSAQSGEKTPQTMINAIKLELQSIELHKIIIDDVIISFILLISSR